MQTDNETPSKDEAKPSTLGKTEAKTGKVEISEVNWNLAAQVNTPLHSPWMKTKLISLAN